METSSAERLRERLSAVLGAQGILSSREDLGSYAFDAFCEDRLPDAVALPLASAWYPPEFQGTALGIAGAGNSGTVLAALFAPALAIAFGWQNVIGLAAIPLLLTLCIFIFAAKDSPNTPAPKPLAAYFALLKVGDWNGTSANWTVPLENIAHDGVDAAVVFVQDGSRDRPGPMLGAAYTSLH